MGAKTSLLVYTDGDPIAILRSRPRLDRAAARRLVDALFPGLAGGDAPDPETTLREGAFPNERLICAASFPGLDIVGNQDVAIDQPSQLSPSLVEAGRGRTIYLHAMHSVVDWAAFAVWEKGRLVRALSVSPDAGVVEDVGEPLEFEVPYWAGGRPVENDGEGEDAYSLPFHPLDLAEAALASFFGFHLEGEMTEIDPCEILLAVFQRTSRG